MRPMCSWSMVMILSRMLPAFDGVVLAGEIAGAVQALADGAVEDVEDQRGFAGAGDARHGDQQAQRQAHGDVLQVVLARAVDGEALPLGARRRCAGQGWTLARPDNRR